MAILRKFIGLNQIDGERVRLDNNELFRALNAAGNADVNILKVNSSDELEFQLVPYLPADASADGQAVRKGQMDAKIAAELLNYIASSQKGVANGVATLDADGLIPTSQLPNLAITDVFVVADQAAMLALSASVGDVAIRTDISKTFILSQAPASTLENWKEILVPAAPVQSVNSQTGNVVLTSDNISEGSTNKYFTDSRAKTASVVNGMTGGQTDQAPSVSSVKGYIDSEISGAKSYADGVGTSTLAAANSYTDSAIAAIPALTGFRGSKTLNATDITNQYIDLPHLVYTDTLHLSSSRVVFYEGDDYTLSTVGGVTRVTFVGPLAVGGAEALVSGDKLHYKALKQ